MCERIDDDEICEIENTVCRRLKSSFIIESTSCTITVITFDDRHKVSSGKSFDLSVVFLIER
jgi:hypothetical protein